MRRIEFAVRRAVVAVALGVCAILALADAALAQSHEQILETCRQTVGRPIVQACMNHQRGPPTEACRSKASPAVRACYQAAAARIGASKGAPAAPKDDTETAAKGSGPVATTFVAPPRTIADITAILDNEKPDAAKLAERKADAEAAPPKSGSS